MPEKLAEVFEQYDMEMIGTKKGRGATIITTKDGVRILEPFRGSMTRLEQEYVLKQLFIKEGCDNLDCIYLNRDNGLLTCDKYRQPFVLKKHFEGSECDMENPSDVTRAVEALAKFHIHGRRVSLLFRGAWQRAQKEKEERRIEEIKRAIADGNEVERISYMYEISQSTLEGLLETSNNDKKESVSNNGEQMEQLLDNIDGMEFNIENTFIRHNKELRKIQKFVSRVKHKKTFENLFLQVFDDYYKQGEQCVAMLSKALQSDKDGLAQHMLQNHYGICHGSYNHHNVILQETGEAIVHFERFSIGNQLCDLYQFARKAMEKNRFDYVLLENILETYSSHIQLTQEDYYYIYVLFFYPEKFWKIANSYYNTNKAFLSPKYLEKLENVILQEKEKTDMLSQYFTLHFQ